MVDAGNLYWRSGRLTTQEKPQQVEKARLMAEAMHASGVDAMLLADGDLAIGLDEVKRLAEQDELPYLATNLDCGGFPGTDRVIAKSGLTVGVLGVVNPKLAWPGCTVSDPAAAVEAGVTRLREQHVDVFVLLDALTDEASEGLLKTVTGIDLVVGGTSQPLQSPAPVPGGGLQLGPGGRGRNVGVLTFTLVDGATAWREDSTLGRLASQKDRFGEKVAEAKRAAESAKSDQDRLVAEKRATYYQKQVDDVAAQLALVSAASVKAHTAHNTLVTLDSAVADDADTLARVDAAKARIAQVALDGASGPGSPGAGPTAPDASAPGAPGPVPGVPLVGPYVGNEACTGCHASEAAQWARTAHAQAYAALQAKHRELDQECYACHVTGAVAIDGPVLGPTRPTDVAGLTNVGCEACHGPGREHAETPSTPMSVPQQATCVACHDAKQDDGRFDFATYLPKIVHGGEVRR